MEEPQKYNRIPRQMAKAGRLQKAKGMKKTQNEQISNEIFVFPLNFFLFLKEKPPKIWYCRNLGVYLQEKEVIWT